MADTDKQAQEGREVVKGVGMKPLHHPQLNLFMPFLAEPQLKGDLHTGQVPVFSISKTKDTRIKTFETTKGYITITPSVLGCATQDDKDILIYIAAHLMSAINRNQPISKKVKLTGVDVLQGINRKTGGKDYKGMEKALHRLKATNIKTSIKTNEIEATKEFSFINDWEIVTTTKTGRLSTIVVEISDWFYNALVGREVLSYHQDYFRLSGGITKRLYEIARKFCGKKQVSWTISANRLRELVGSTAPTERFKKMVLLKMGGIGGLLDLLDYEMFYVQKRNIFVFQRKIEFPGDE